MRCIHMYVCVKGMHVSCVYVGVYRGCTCICIVYGISVHTDTIKP